MKKKPDSGEIRVNVAKEVASKWLSYAEKTLGEGNVPERLSDSFYTRAYDIISGLPAKDQKACGKGKEVIDAIGSLAVNMAMKTVFKNPLLFPQVLRHFTQSFRKDV